MSVMYDGGGMLEFTLFFVFIALAVCGSIFIYCFVRDMYKLYRELRDWIRRRKHE